MQHHVLDAKLTIKKRAAQTLLSWCLLKRYISPTAVITFVTFLRTVTIATLMYFKLPKLVKKFNNNNKNNNNDNTMILPLVIFKCHIWRNFFVIFIYHVRKSMRHL